MTRALLRGSLAALIAVPALAQSIPSVARATTAARKAAAATKPHTTAMTDARAVEHMDTTRTATPKRAPATIRRAPAHDSAAGTAMVKESPATTSTPTKAAEPNAVEGFRREVFSYAKSGRRDPFVSLMNTSELRPLVSDLKLVAVVYDPTGRSSVAILRDLGTKEQYRVRLGQTLGRMRDARIEPKSVVFTIEEFGFSRQEELGLGDPTQARKK
jgi:hypothetical protein